MNGCGRWLNIATMKLVGFEAYENMLERLISRMPDIIGKTVYSGAEVVADEVKQSIRKIPADEAFGTPDEPSSGLKQIQIQGLENSFGISKIRNDKGLYNVKLGFDGYNHLKTKSHPKGQPNAMIARAAESGTTFSKKIPFMRTAVNGVRSKTVSEMKKTADRLIRLITEK